MSLSQVNECEAGSSPIAPPEMASVLEAVCAELGIRARETRRRAAVASRIAAAWERGPRHPLNLVSAGLGDTYR